MTIGEFIKRVKDPIAIKPDDEYRLLTIRLHHKGIVERGKKRGIEIGSKLMYRVKAGQFILSGIDARNGAFGIIPENLDGSVVSNDFWYFDIDDKVVDKHLFLYLTSTAIFDDICRKASDGTTNRVRLQADKFYSQSVNLPPLPKQKKLLEMLRKCDELKTQIKQNEKQVDLLLQTILKEAFEAR